MIEFSRHCYEKKSNIYQVINFILFYLNYVLGFFYLTHFEFPNSVGFFPVFLFNTADIFKVCLLISSLEVSSKYVKNAWIIHEIKEKTHTNICQKRKLFPTNFTYLIFFHLLISIDIYLIVLLHIFFVFSISFLTPNAKFYLFFIFSFIYSYHIFFFIF